MNIQPIGNNKFIVGLSCDDLKNLDITYEAMDYSDIETRRVIWTILERVRNSTGRDIDPSGNLIIEASPDSSGGCILIITVPFSRSDIGTVISKKYSTQIFEFENSDCLLDVISAVGRVPDESRFFTDGKRFRIEIPSVISVFSRHTIEEFGRFIGNDSMTVALTHEHWSEIKKSAT